jgi:hypothetical protein
MSAEQTEPGVRAKSRAQEGLRALPQGQVQDGLGAVPQDHAEKSLGACT